jgi:hypothetical protein
MQPVCKTRFIYMFWKYIDISGIDRLLKKQTKKTTKQNKKKKRYGVLVLLIIAEKSRHETTLYWIYYIRWSLIDEVGALWLFFFYLRNVLPQYTRTEHYSMNHFKCLIYCSQAFNATFIVALG